MNRSSTTTKSIGTYLLNQLYNYGTRHIFGVPGDFEQFEPGANEHGGCSYGGSPRR